MYSLHTPSVTVNCVDCYRYNHYKLCTKFFVRFMPQTAQMRRTTEGRSIRLHPSQNERRSDTGGTCRVRVSRKMDTSTTVIMAKTWQNFEEPGKECVRTRPFRFAMGKTVRKGSTLEWIGESTNVGVSVLASSEMSVPVRVCARHLNWRERNRILSPFGRN